MCCENQPNKLKLAPYKPSIHLIEELTLATYTIIYRLIATAAITFSKRKGMATKQGRLLYESGH